MAFKTCLRLVSCASVACFVIALRGQGTLRTITFDGPPTIPPGANIGETYYYEDSMSFTPIKPGDQFTRAGGGIAVFPEDGSPYLLQGAFDSLSGSRGGISRFGLHSVDLSEFSILYDFPRTAQFVGYRLDGTIVTAEFTTDGVIDGTGPGPDFQTFHFDTRFSDLVRFEVPTHTYALDNLVFFDVVPEPSVCSLLLVAGGVVGHSHIVRKRRLLRNAKKPPLVETQIRQGDLIPRTETGQIGGLSGAAPVSCWWGA